MIELLGKLLMEFLKLLWEFLQFSLESLANGHGSYIFVLFYMDKIQQRGGGSENNENMTPCFLDSPYHILKTSTDPEE